jgi:hypothetical protein
VAPPSWSAGTGILAADEASQAKVQAPRGLWATARRFKKKSKRARKPPSKNSGTENAQEQEMEIEIAASCTPGSISVVVFPI